MTQYVPGVRLTPYQGEVYDYLATHTGRERHGSGPWYRAWVGPRTTAESRAMAQLAGKGLVDRKPGRHGGNRYALYRLDSMPLPPPYTCRCGRTDPGGCEVRGCYWKAPA